MSDAHMPLTPLQARTHTHTHTGGPLTGLFCSRVFVEGEWPGLLEVGLMEVLTTPALAIPQALGEREIEGERERALLA